MIWIVPDILNKREKTKMRSSEFVIESVQSYNQLDNDEIYQKCLDSWTDYYDNKEKAHYELDNYKYQVDNLIKNGGKIYRVIFANSPEDIKMSNLGHSWTTDQSNIDDYSDSLWSNYGSGKKNMYVVVAEVGPNNINNNGVDISGNPEEKEVNIINPNQAKYQIHQYKNKQLGSKID